MYNLLPYGLLVEIGRSAGLCVQMLQWPTYLDLCNFGKHTLGTFNLKGYSKMQMRCLFTAADKDNIVRNALKRQVKENQYLIYTNLIKNTCLAAQSFMFWVAFVKEKYIFTNPPGFNT